MSARPKILQVIAGARFGGAETAFADTCVALAEDGYEQHIVTRSHPERLERFSDHNIPYSTLPFGGKIDFYTPLRLRKIITRFQPDIVQSWMSRASAKLPAKDSEDKYKVISRLGNYYKLKNFKETDAFLAITPKIKDYIQQSDTKGRYVTFLPNFAETESNVQPINRQSLDTPDDATVCLTLARYHDSKALDVAIKAIKDLPDTYLWLAGEGPDREDLIELAKAQGVYERCRFLGWRNDRAALLQAADICLFISRFEPFGTVFVQSWAEKTPVIVSDADGPAQFVKNGEDGLVVPKDDVDALTKAITHLKDSKELQDKFIEKGYARYEHEFSKESTLKAYAELYNHVLNPV